MDLIVFIMFVFFQISRVNLMCKQNQSILSKTHFLILALYLKKLCLWNFFVQLPIPFCRLILHSRKKLNEYPFDHWIWFSILFNTTKSILCVQNFLKITVLIPPRCTHEFGSMIVWMESTACLNILWLSFSRGRSVKTHYNLTTDGSTHFWLQLHSWKQFLRGCRFNLSIHTTVNDQRTNCWIVCHCGISGKKHGAGKEVVNVEKKQAKWDSNSQKAHNLQHAQHTASAGHGLLKTINR